jgi:hypothetical protein
MNEYQQSRAFWQNVADYHRERARLTAASDPEESRRQKRLVEYVHTICVAIMDYNDAFKEK